MVAPAITKLIFINDGIWFVHMYNFHDDLH